MRRRSLGVTTWAALLGVWLAAACSDSQSPEGVTSQTLKFEDELLDLETGVVSTCAPPSPNFCPATSDLKISYNSQTTVHSVVFQNSQAGRRIAHLLGRSFSSVALSDTAGAGLTTSYITASFDASRVILIYTDANKFYKLGNPVESATGLTFNTALLE